MAGSAPILMFLGLLLLLARVVRSTGLALARFHSALTEWMSVYLHRPGQRLLTPYVVRSCKN